MLDGRHINQRPINGLEFDSKAHLKKIIINISLVIFYVYKGVKDKNPHNVTGMHT